MYKVLVCDDEKDIVSAISLSLIHIFFIMLENPMANIDRDTGFFNLNALFEYMKEAYGQGNDVSLSLIHIYSKIQRGEYL